MRKKLSEVFDVWSTPYIWTKIHELTQYEELDPTEMGVEYASRSAEKLISPLLEHVTDESKLATIIYNRYKHQWEHLHQLLLAEYNPIHNYDRKETESVDTTDTLTGNRSGTENRVDDRTRSGSVSDKGKTTTKDDMSNTTMDKTNVATKESGTDTGTISTEKTNTVTDTKTVDLTDTKTPQTTEKEQWSGSDTVAHSQASFGAGVQQTSKDETSKGTTNTKTISGTDTEKHTGTEKTDSTENGTDVQTLNTKSTHDLTDTITKDVTEIKDGSSVVDVTNTRTDEGSDHLTGNVTTSDKTDETRAGKSTRTTNISGNIGITTTQQMMESELMFWHEVYDFRRAIMEDVDKILTLGIY